MEAVAERAAGRRALRRHRRSGRRGQVYAVLADSARALLRAGTATLDSDRFPSLTPECPQVHLFERELAEQYGVRPEGHPWFKPVRFHASYRPGHDAWGRAPGEPPVVGVTDFFRVEGEEIHEVAVGPVHAGVIEPGHFRFQCHGEQVFHLEISLGYQHRGIERALVGGPDKRTIHLMEQVAGDTSIGHAPHTARPWSRWPGARPRSGRRRSAGSPWNWNGWPTTQATWGPWPATSGSCRQLHSAGGSGAISST